jgi:probable F420-dependent oxidoreductase
MKVDGTVGFNLKNMASVVADAEATGYAGLWVAETSHDPFVSLALAAPHANRCDLGTAIAVAFARNPMTTAMAANDLQLAANGRFLLGLGSQIKPHIERRFSMPWSHPAPRMREFILAMRAIWDCWNNDTKLDFRGQYYTHTLMTPFFNPGPNQFGPPKVFLAAVGEQMTEVAGEVADGLLVHAFTTERYLREVTLPALDRGFAKAGKTRADVELSYPGFVVTGDDDEQIDAAASFVRQQIAFYGSTPAYRGVLERHGWGDLHPELNRMSKLGAWTEMASLVDDEMLNTFAVVASPEDLGPKVLERFGGLVDRFSFYAQFGMEESRMRGMLAGFGLERATS